MERNIVLLGCAALICACAASDDAAGGIGNPGDESGVSFGGAQDFGLFRQIIERGGIPTPDTLDAAGFFAEHWLDLPPPDCGRPLCLQGLLGVAGNMMDGSNCTLLRIGMNTQLDDEDLPALPKKLVVVLDHSGSMQEDEKIVYAREGLKLMVDALDPEDQLGLVVYNDNAQVVRGVAPVDDAAAVKALIDSIDALGSTNFYDGLDLGFTTLAEAADAEHQNRVIMVSDGLPTVGVTSPEVILDMAFAWAAEGFALTTVGVGTDFGVDLMRSLAEYGAGNFYFADDAAALTEIFVDELDYFTQPIAHEVTIHVNNGAGYFSAETFGTHLWDSSEGGVTISLPSLFLARRESDEPGENGRRGGGGTLLIETLPAGGNAEDSSLVAEITMEYRLPGSEDRSSQTIEVRYDEGPGVTLPEGSWTDIDGSSLDMRKAFVMLNIFVAFRLAAVHAAIGGDLSTAYGVLEQIEQGVDDWLDEWPDTDIESDHALILQFMINLLDEGAADGEPVQENPWPQD